MTKCTYTHMMVTSRLNWLSLDGVLSLWRSVADSGLMGEVLSSLQTELLATLKGVELRSVKAHLQEAGQCQMVQPFRKEAIISDLKKYLYLCSIFFTQRPTHYWKGSLTQNWRVLEFDTWEEFHPKPVQSGDHALNHTKVIKMSSYCSCDFIQ